MVHTPGPWVVGGPYPKITVCQPAAFDDPWIPIAEVWPSVDHEASDEVKANAQLIARAPELQAESDRRLALLRCTNKVRVSSGRPCPLCGKSIQVETIEGLVKYIDNHADGCQLAEEIGG